MIRAYTFDQIGESKYNSCKNKRIDVLEDAWIKLTSHNLRVKHNTSENDAIGRLMHFINSDKFVSFSNVSEILSKPSEVRDVFCQDIQNRIANLTELEKKVIALF